jgi:hypothetical protein
LPRWIAGQVPNEDVRVEEGAQARVFARASRVRRLISGHGVPRFCAGTVTLAARSSSFGVRASSARRAEPSVARTARMPPSSHHRYSFHNPICAHAPGR